jgi:hypothetical protein
MKKIKITDLAILFIGMMLPACQDNHATEPGKNGIEVPAKETIASPKTDDAAIGFIKTENYVMKLHSVFNYKPKPVAGMANMEPKPGFRFIYLDVSLRNTGTAKLDGGDLFIALKITDKNGIEYKKPAMALAAYATEHPDDQSDKEYNALWEKFEPNEFHRALIYAVEVPVNIKKYILSLPVDRTRKEWREIEFEL